MIIRTALLCVLLACPSLVYAWPGVVLDVHDGDTLTVRHACVWRLFSPVGHGCEPGAGRP